MAIVNDDDYIITEQDLEDLKSLNFEDVRELVGKPRFCASEMFKWFEDKNTTYKTVGEFRQSLIGRDIRE